MAADSGDLIVRNLTTNQTIPAGALAVQTLTDGAGGWTYRWKYTGSGVLPDGLYRATLPAGSVSGFDGRAMPQDIVVEFTVLAGDANHDGQVNLLDFNILAANFNGTNKTFSQGDFNYDGVVNLLDFNVLASRFNRALSAGATAGGRGTRQAVQARPRGARVDMKPRCCKPARGRPIGWYGPPFGNAWWRRKVGSP